MALSLKSAGFIQGFSLDAKDTDYKSIAIVVHSPKFVFHSVFAGRMTALVGAEQILAKDLAPFGTWGPRLSPGSSFVHYKTVPFEQSQTLSRTYLALSGVHKLRNS